MWVLKWERRFMALKKSELYSSLWRSWDALRSGMDTEIEALEAKLSKARQIKEGMMSVLLTGKTRMVGVGKPSVKYEQEEPELRMVAEK
jgi:hypothetical protein